MHEDVAVSALQRGAGDHGALAGLANPVDLVGDGLQPGPAIFIGQGLAGAHLGDIAGRMKPVAIFVSPLQALGQSVGDSAFARSGHTHHHQGTRIPVDLTAHENSPAAQLYPPARSSRLWNARGSPAGSRHQAHAPRSHACPRPRLRTAFHGRSRAWAGSASPAARRARHAPWGRPPPNSRSLQSPDTLETPTPRARL